MKTGVIEVKRAARTATLLMVALVGVQGTAMAQDNEQPLDLPPNVTVLGHTDPSVRKATAIINSAIITDTDVDQRLALVITANQGKISDEERTRLRQQVLSNLVDETLQIQEAAANKITIEKADIDQTFNRVAGQFKRPGTTFPAYLRQQGSSEASLRRQIEGEIAWRRLLSREVEPFVNVSDEEVNQVIARLKAAKGTNEYHVGEIYLSASPLNEAQVRANADRIVEQVRKGASFVAYARQYSEASTKSVGGDLGWVRAEQLPDQLAALLPQMPNSTVSDVIPVNGGFSIIAMIDRRQVLTADPRDAVLALKQLAITFPAGATQQTAGPKVQAFSNALKTLQGCGSAAAVAATVGADVVDNDQVKIRDLPPQLQDIMVGLRVGEVTPPFGSVTDGVRALVVCGRDEPEAAGTPSFDEIQNQMEEERVNLRARRYLRDLRRDAVIDYR